MRPIRPAASASHSVAVTGWNRKMWPTCKRRPAARAAASSSRPSSSGPGQGLLDETRPPGRQALARNGVMAVRRRDDVHRVDAVEHLAIVGNRTARLHTLAHRPLPSRRRHVRRPEADPELAEHAQVLFTPTAEPDQQDVHGGGSVGATRSPPTSSTTSYRRSRAFIQRMTRRSAKATDARFRTPYFDRPKRRGRWLTGTSITR